MFTQPSGDDVGAPTPTLAALVAASGRWHRVEHHAAVGSTNDLAGASLDEHVAPGVVVVADHQRVGRGRRGRAWSDHPGGASLLVSITTPTPPVPTLVPLAAGVAVADAVATLGLNVALKWPNDVFVPRPAGDAKLAGILTEGRPTGVVVGIGVNVDHRGLASIPGATSLAEELDRDVDRWDVLASLLGTLDDALGLLDAGRTSALLARYRRRCATLGRPVVVHLADGGELRGTAGDVTSVGALVVTPGDGRPVVEVTAGDVEHVRPADG